jgi:xanthine/uracil permease
MVMKEFIKKNILKIIGIAVGAIGGYAYYHFVGCASGQCPITSNPYISILYGATMGYLLFDMFKKKEKQVNQ